MKIIKKSNFRVVVEPRRLGDYGNIKISDNALYTEQRAEKEYQRRCDEIVEQIKRHVDDVASAEVDYDAEAVCSHCGRAWEQDETGKPQCCTKAEKEFEESKTQVVNP
jgi:hypothetical protein